MALTIRYALSRWAALTRHSDDGRLEIDNNTAERALCTVALGRKNWLFAGSDDGGDRAAAIYSLIGTAKLNGLNPDLTYNTLCNVSQIPLSTKSTSCYRRASWRKCHHFKWPHDEPGIMDKKLPQSPEMKTLLTQLGCNKSPQRKLETHAVIAARIIERVRRQSRLKK